MNAFLTHHRWHHNGMTTKQYYDKYLKKENEEICETPDCNTKCNFWSLTKGYNKHCSRKCAFDNLNKSGIMKKAKIKKNGFYNNNRNKSKETCLKKYGVENVSQIKEVKEKQKKTSLKNNGYEHWVGSKEHINWMKNGGAAYCNMFIKNPSKPQVKLFELCQETLPYPILNYPSGRYSIDIAIPQLSLAIEYDGSYWHPDKEYDKYRQEILEKEGWCFLRYIDEVPNKEQLINDVKRKLE